VQTCAGKLYLADMPDDAFE
jgi:IclR family transcriptional regulator, acetate operon repressor